MYLNGKLFAVALLGNLQPSVALIQILSLSVFRSSFPLLSLCLRLEVLAAVKDVGFGRMGCGAWKSCLHVGTTVLEEAALISSLKMGAISFFETSITMSK
jgi:hypothetical protein